MQDSKHASSLLSHLEWSIAHQLFLDFWLASLDPSMHKRVLQYLTAAYNSAIATSEVPTNPLEG